MDTSKEYIKQCDCPEAQVGGYTTLNSGEEIQYVGDNVFIELDRCSTTWRTIRLLRQSQIQEMLGYGIGALVHDLWEFCTEDLDVLMNPDNFPKSMEQLWLAFYMFEKHHKLWDGKKWVKSVKE